MSTTATQRIVLAFYYERTDGVSCWKRAAGERDDAEPWQKPGTWPGERDDRRALIYVGVERFSGESLDDLYDDAALLADDKFYRLYPRAILLP
jgi:hypothetical protein